MKNTKYTLPLYCDGELIDRISIDLEHDQIQELLDAIVSGFENYQMDNLRNKLEELNIIDINNCESDNVGVRDISHWL